MTSSQGSVLAHHLITNGTHLFAIKLVLLNNLYSQQFMLVCQLPDLPA